ncbi:XdhC family protein [Fulvivirga sedimenti]|jgi:xanthine dehydrogenase accessory factor|uniref:XdhC family protein n=1 Tax=Fulvivirga sedimenti TaxID=2879465 RepID=A0A9X1HN03_9BACT|nr:XdhC family protein [Fulvivirga sedimenti]MCA6074501.1 XdhC family protein [Fulvivirga sedimenti]MCA6075678.1 XdhC family protein [Fulvivirga sedimenti]MCA6076806.1 XdhC family protein [Fulvivirga sedimenti]
MFKQTLLKEIELAQKQQKAAAIAQVVRREAPTSGKPGDKALITADGQVHGWIGGGCTKGIVIKEAVEAIREQTPRLVRIQNGMQTPEQSGVKNYGMTCMSGGAVEVYIEPIMTVTEIIIFGRSHIAKALSEIGSAAGFSVSVVSDVAEKEMFPMAQNIMSLEDFLSANMPAIQAYAVVCTQGEDDARHLETAIHANPKYLAFVSSRKKANSIFMGLKRSGISHDQLVKIQTPAGLDINAKTPEEVAISILAQIIQHKYAGAGESTSNLDEMELTEDLYINPVCKIPVQKSTAKYVLEYEGEKVYFCCDGCKESFEKNPAAYMV